jgi:hypothetical protein
MPSWLDRCNFFFVTRMEEKKTSPMFRDVNPNVSSYESHPASGQLATLLDIDVDGRNCEQSVCTWRQDGSL